MVPQDSSDIWSLYSSCPISDPVSPGVEHIEGLGDTRFVISGYVKFEDDVGDLEDGRGKIEFGGNWAE